MKVKLTDLQKLSLDTYNGNIAQYGKSKEEGNEAIRKAIEDACGGEYNYYNFLDNKGKVFSVISEVLSIGLGVILMEQFNEFAEVHDVALGDKKEFIIENDNLFRVAEISDGNWDIRRQTIYNSKLDINTHKLGIKIYTDLDLFVAGRIPWASMVSRVERSYAHEMGKKIYEAVYNAYDLLSAPYQVSGTYSADKLQDAIAHVEAQTGMKACVMGTKKGLSKITEAQISESMKDEYHKMGHYGSFYGTELRELPQAHVVGTDTFAVNDDFLIIIPDGEKFVKVILEGDATVYDTPAGVRHDEQIEFFFGRKVGIGVLVARNFAVYRLA